MTVHFVCLRTVALPFKLLQLWKFLGWFFLKIFLLRLCGLRLVVFIAGELLAVFCVDCFIAAMLAHFRKSCSFLDSFSVFKV